MDPESSWRVQPASAQISSTNNGAAWDDDSTPPDVAVSMGCPPSTMPVASLTPATESYAPTWSTGGCVTKAKSLLAEPWIYSLWDVDTDADDRVTDLLDYQVTEADFARGTFTLPGSSGMQSMTVELHKQ